MKGKNAPRSHKTALRRRRIIAITVINVLINKPFPKWANYVRFMVNCSRITGFPCADAAVRRGESGDSEWARLLGLVGIRQN